MSEVHKLQNCKVSTKNDYINEYVCIYMYIFSYALHEQLTIYIQMCTYILIHRYLRKFSSNHLVMKWPHKNLCNLNFI